MRYAAEQIAALITANADAADSLSIACTLPRLTAHLLSVQPQLEAVQVCVVQLVDDADPVEAVCHTRAGPLAPPDGAGDDEARRRIVPQVPMRCKCEE